MPLGLHSVFSHFQSKKLLVSVLIDYDNNILFLTTCNMNLYNKIYTENERSILDHEENVIEKEDRKSYIVSAVVTQNKIKCAAFVGK